MNSQEAVRFLIERGIDPIDAAAFLLELTTSIPTWTKKRSAAAERTARYRERKRHGVTSQGVTDQPRNGDGRYTVVTSQCDAVHNTKLTEEVVKEEPIIPSKGEDLLFVASGKSKVTRGTRIDPRWRIAEGGETWKFAASAGLDPATIRDQFDQFRDYWLAKTGAKALKSDWPAAWRWWVRNHLKFQKQEAAKFGRVPAGFNPDIDGPLVGVM